MNNPILKASNIAKFFGKNKVLNAYELGSEIINKKLILKVIR